MITYLESMIAEARDPETSLERLWELFYFRQVEVQRAMLNNPRVCFTNAKGKLYTSLLKALAEEFPEEVATHPVFVLHALVEPNEEFEGLLRAVVERTKDVGLIEHVLRTWEPSLWWVRQGVASNPNTPEDLLRVLGNPATESEGRVRRVVAENPRTSVDMLRTLGNQKSESEWSVRLAVAANTRVPEDVLRTLGNEMSESYAKVREGVAKNPSTPVDVLRSLNNKKTESIVWVRETAKRALADRDLA